jgi:antitoxin (DNA-binding transcriptional repressor) of toxin-antitoxin stability system
MATAGIRDLKNNLSRYLRRLKPGEAIAITDRGRVVAQLRAAPAGESPGGRYVELVAHGLIRPASEAGDPLAAWPKRPAIALPRGTAAALIAQDRGG